MKKRTVEIDDTLEDRTQEAIAEVKDALINYLTENPDTESLPDLNNDLDYSGEIHEIVDGSVPIYTGEVTDTWYLYKEELEEAYKNAGCGDNPLENDWMSAIYFYIMEKVQEWYSDNAKDVFDSWKDLLTKKEGAKQ